MVAPLLTYRMLLAIQSSARMKHPGTWTESVYEYGTETGGQEDDPDLEQEENDRLLEERTYTFQPDEKKFIVRRRQNDS